MHENNDNKPRRRGFFSWLWNAFTRPSTRFGVGVLVLIGMIAGVAAWAGFHSFVAYTNTPEYCLSCHEMRAFVYPEVQERPHFSTRSGVRPMCADCHVPRAYFPMMASKIKATMVELPGHLLGRIDTREKFEAHRETMAERVWARMKANDSRECRSCHLEEAMSQELQTTRAWRSHQDAIETGETCIDCHQGIAHQLPESYLEPDEDEELEFDF